jgi:hypothetical protein
MNRAPTGQVRHSGYRCVSFGQRVKTRCYKMDRAYGSGHNIGTQFYNSFRRELTEQTYPNPKPLGLSYGIKKQKALAKAYSYVL